MGVKNVVKRIGAKAGDKVAKLSALSPEQVAQVQLQRENYLLEKVFIMWYNKDNYGIMHVCLSCSIK